MNNKENKYFYSKFIDEDSLMKIDDINIQDRFSTYSYAIVFITGPSCLLPFFSGFNMETLMCDIINYINFLLFFGLCYYSIRFLIIIHKYKVFKNILHGYLFVFTYVLLSVIFSLVAYFTTKVQVTSFFDFKVEFNLGLYILIFLPLFIIFTIYSYYAYLNCFRRYSKMYKRIHKNEND